MMNSGVPPGLVVTKNEQGQLVVVQQFQLQQPQSRPAQVVRPIIQASIIATATTTSSASAAAGTRSLFIQPQHILPHTQQQQQLTATTTLTQRVPLLPVQPTTTTMIVAQQQQPQLQLAPNVIVNQQQQQLSLTNQIQPNGDALTSINKEVVENVRKCKNFLSTLLKLAANQPKETLDNVLSLIQGLVDNAVTPEEFTTQLQKELKSSPQPYLIPFLKKSLPYLRQFLSNNKMQIDGIRPPISNASPDDTNSNNTNNIIIQNNTNSIVNTTNNNNNSVVFLTATQQQQQLQQQQQTIVAATTSQASMLAVDGSNSRTTIRPVTGIPQQQQKLQNIQQQQQIRLMQALPISNNNSSNNNNTNNSNNNISATPETTRLLQTRFSNPSSTTHQLLNNLTTGQQKLQAQQLAALHTNTNFIAPTTPLPSSLPRLILSSNSTLLASFPQVQPVSTTPTTTVAAIIATTTQAAVAAATTTTTLAAPKVINNINNNMTATLLRNNNNILPTSLAAQQQLHQHRQQQIQQHLQASRPEKRKFEAISRTEDDDINDVATMGGVNLNEETRNILSVTSILSAGQLRSCTEESFLDQHLLSKFVSTIAQRKGLSTVQPDSINMLSMAVKEKLKTILEQLSVLSEHRTEIYKNEKLLTLKSEVKRQMKFRQEIARLEGERVREIESQAIMKAAKSRTKTDDPDQLKKKELAKKQQMQEMEDKRKEQSNITALAAIGPRKQRSFTILPDSLLASSASSSSNHHILTNNSVGSTGGLLNVSGVLNNGNVLGGSFSLPGQTLPLRNRVKRATSKDLLYIMQQDKRLSRSALLYKAFMKF